MERIKLQYLIGFSTKIPFCKSQKAFLNLFNTLDATVIESPSKIKYKDIYINYKIRTIDKKDEEIKYFDLTLSINEEINIEKFVMFLSSAKKLLMNVTSNSIETIWNDVGLFYSRKSYPYIYEIENLMRMLITKFMILKVGLKWTKENVPDEVKKSFKNDTKNIKSDYLYEVDFIQLSHFLFKKYSDYSIDDMYKIMEQTEHTLEKEVFSSFIPKSNWYRYFSELVDCDDNYIIKRWDRLYVLRCKIAHNNHIIKRDYDEIIKLTLEVKVKLEEALEKLSEISITKEEKEEISVNFAISKSVNAFDFFSAFKHIKDLIEISETHNNETGKIFDLNYDSFINYSKDINYKIPDSLINKIIELQKYRNQLVHGYNTNIDSDEILVKIEESENVANEFLKIMQEGKSLNDKTG